MPAVRPFVSPSFRPSVSLSACLNPNPKTNTNPMYLELEEQQIQAKYDGLSSERFEAAKKYPKNTRMLPKIYYILIRILN